MFLTQTFAAAPPELPKTTVGNIAEKFLAAVNSADPSETDKFVDETITEVPSNQMTREKYRQMFRKLREQSGDLTVERIFMADKMNLRVLIASAKAEKKVGLEIVLPEANSTQACWLWIHHFPGKGPAPFPTESLGESAQIEALEKYLSES